MLYKADLRGANLWGAQLQNAKLRYAILQGVDLCFANLQNADLEETDLLGAELDHADLKNAQDLRDEQFVEARSLQGATMPSGKRYDGRYRLEWDLINAHQSGKRVDDLQSMASFYEVPLEVYQKGQEWAQENLSKFSPRPFTPIFRKYRGAMTTFIP